MAPPRARPGDDDRAGQPQRPPQRGGRGGRLRYLPAYSPDFNPIELAFAKLKTHLRGVAARAFDGLVDAIGTGFDRITTADIAGYYRHCGFPLPTPTEQPS